MSLDNVPVMGDRGPHYHDGADTQRQVTHVWEHRYTSGLFDPRLRL